MVSQRETKMKRLEESLRLWQSEAKTELERSARKAVSMDMLKCAQQRSQRLVLSDLSSAPPGLGALEHLHELYIFDSQIETLPDDVGDCSNLTVLNITDCEIASLPESIGRLDQLERLELHCNTKLKSLPDSLGMLPWLRTIDVRDCENLEQFPASIDLYKVSVKSEGTKLVIYPPFREANFDEETRMELEESAKDCKTRWDHLTAAFSPEQLSVAHERDALKRARLSSTVSQMALPGEEPIPGVTFDNWKRADALTTEWAQAKVPLGPERLLELHASLYSGVDHWRMNGSLAGKLRDAEIWCDENMYPPHQSVPRMMDEFFLWHRRTIAPLKDSDDLVGRVAFAGQIYQRLVSIHPFHDGNGRIARLAMNWELRAAGLPPARIGRNGAGSGLAVALFATQGTSNRRPNEVTEMVLEGIENTLRVYEAVLGVTRGEDGDCSDLSDDEHLLEVVAAKLQKRGWLGPQHRSDDESDTSTTDERGFLSKGE